MQSLIQQNEELKQKTRLLQFEIDFANQQN